LVKIFDAISVDFLVVHLQLLFAAMPIGQLELEWPAQAKKFVKYLHLTLTYAIKITIVGLGPHFYRTKNEYVERKMKIEINLHIHKKRRQVKYTIWSIK
jgi:hypothetical protein